MISFVVFLLLFSRVFLFVTPWTATRQALLSSALSWSLLKFMSTESVMLSNHLILYRPLLLLPSIFPSIQVFSNQPTLFPTPMLGKMEGKRRREQQRMRWLDSFTDSMEVNLSKLWETIENNSNNT